MARLDIRPSFPSAAAPWFDECEVTQRKKNRNQMANAHITKHGYCDVGMDTMHRLRLGFLEWA
jgi:hypothetical protein